MPARGRGAMKQQRPAIHSNDLVWRISESAPMGEWVAKGSPVRKAAAQESSSTDSWATSSFDLLNGAQAVEVTDSVSGDLFDELFAGARKDTP
jgi:hypothetical protein